MKLCKKRYITLIEIIIVIFLIGLIGGVLAYNLTGTLDKGKAFATEQGMQRLNNILELSVAERPQLLNNLESEWETAVQRSPLVDNPSALIYDGWGSKYQVTVENGVITIRSENLNRYNQNQGQ